MYVLDGDDGLEEEVFTSSLMALGNTVQNQQQISWF
jgi:hypothetical protein